MSKELPYFRWYPQDAEADTKYSSMTLSELGLYHRAMNHAWNNDGLPADPEEVRRALRLTQREMRLFWPRVSNCFTQIDSKLRNTRQEEERLYAKTKSLKASESVKVRYERNTSVPTNELPRAYESESVSVSESSSLNLTKTDDVEIWFKEFYAIYPLHKGPHPALKAARKVLKTPELRATAMSALKSQLPEMQSREPSKRPYPATWINERRWEDEPEPLFSHLNGNGRKETFAERLKREDPDYA